MDLLIVGSTMHKNSLPKLTAYMLQNPKKHISLTIRRQNASFPAINITTFTLSTFPKKTPQNSRHNQKTRIIQNMARTRQYWLLKTEPGEWSWDDQAANGGVSKWDGVKNKQAQKYLKAMKIGDLCFFYHSGTKFRCVVGVVSVLREWYSEEEEGNGDGAVDVKVVGEMRRQVDLKEMKGDKGLKGFALFRQPRLSVVPMEESVWKRVCEIGGGFEGDGKEDDEDSGGAIEVADNLV